MPWTLILKALASPTALVLYLAVAIFGAGYTEALKHDHAAELRAQVAEAQREAAASKRVAANAAAREAASNRALQAAKKKVTSYVNEHSQDPSDCRLTDADVRSLRSIGAPTSEPAAPSRAVRPASKAARGL